MSGDPSSMPSEVDQTDLVDLIDATNPNHLTKVQEPRIQLMIEHTPPGMAHWSGTGPAGVNCVDCGHARFNGYYKKTNHQGALKPIKCAQFMKMMPGTAPSFEPRTASCRFYIAGEGAPKRK